MAEDLVALRREIADGVVRNLVASARKSLEMELNGAMQAVGIEIRQQGIGDANRYADLSSEFKRIAVARLAMVELDSFENDYEGWLAGTIAGQ